MRVVEKVVCKFARNDVRTVKFVATRKHVLVVCKGLPTMTIKERPEADHHYGVYQAAVDRGSCIEFVTARTAEAAYRKGVRRLWI